MTARQIRKIIASVRQCDPKIILAAAGRCDGHTILAPEAFIEAGLPADVVAYLTTTHRSDGTPKGTLFLNGAPVKELKGCYGLDVLRFLARALDVEYRSAIGRGFEAQNIQQALHQRLAPASTA